VLLQPTITALIEMVMWVAVFAGAGGGEIAGFSREHYLAYAVWGAFLARISSNWQYEHRMIQEIDSGSVNAFLVRPTSFFEAYWSQFFGYKLFNLLLSLPLPIAFHWYLLGTPVSWRLFPALLLLLFYVFFLHCLSFAVACLAFFFNRVYSLTVAKNLFLWLLSGELFPLDLLGEPWRSVVSALPFSSGVFVPTGYLIGRFDEGVLIQGFLSVGIGVLVVGVIANSAWRAGLKSYTGTGA
jgi:ABC-2 type transport system permease protein